MLIKSYASSSKNNCYEVQNADTKILIECGISFDKLLKKRNFNLSDLDACLISHSHKDHCLSYKDISKFGIDIITSEGTARELNLLFYTKIKDSETIKIKSLEITAFKTIHDTKEPLGFIIKDLNTNETLIFAIDTAFLSLKVKNPNYLMIECNYVEDILNHNIINTELKHRIENTHFSLNKLKRYIKSLDLSNLKQIYVMHLSNDNSDENLIKEELQKLSGSDIIICKE